MKRTVTDKHIKCNLVHKSLLGVIILEVIILVVVSLIVFAHCLRCRENGDRFSGFFLVNVKALFLISKSCYNEERKRIEPGTFIVSENGKCKKPSVCIAKLHKSESLYAKRFRFL